VVKTPLSGYCSSLLQGVATNTEKPSSLHLSPGLNSLPLLFAADPVDDLSA